MVVCGLALAAVFWRLHRSHPAPYLRLWMYGWVCVAVQFAVSGVLWPNWFGAPPMAPLRLAMSATSQLSHYFQLVFMVSGAACLVRGRPLAPWLHRRILAATTLVVVALTLATATVEPILRLNLRMVLRFAVVGLGFTAAAVALALRPSQTRRVGRQVVAIGFASIGLIALSSAGLFRLWTDTETNPVAMEALKTVNLLAHCLVGVGLAVWALEDQHALAAAHSTTLHERTTQLLAAHKMEAIGRLAGGVAHDFHNVLTVFHAIGEQLEQEPALGAGGRKALADLQRAARQATKMTQQLLTMASSRGGTAKVFDLVRVVRDMAPTLRRLLGDELQLATELPAAPALVRLQSGQCEQVLLNLVVNARDAVPPRGTITIRVCSHNGPNARVDLVVIDHGCGMSEALVARAMEPFYTTKGERGTGLGLAVVYGIAHQTDGEVVIDSSPGNGTTVRVSWPLAAGVAEESATHAVPAPLAGGPRTILIADDEPNVLEITVQSLRHAGYQVLPAADAEAAMQIVTTHPGTIDALLSDVLMPGMNGPDLGRAARAVRPAIKVLFVSGYIDPRLEGLMDDDTPLLNKPFTRRQLLAYVEEHLRRTA